MEWITVEIGFSILVPGILPTLFFLWPHIDYFYTKIGPGNLFFLVLFISIVVGLFIEFIRFSSEEIEIDILPAIIVNCLKRIFLKKGLKNRNNETPRDKLNSYEEKEAKAIEFWIMYYYNKKKCSFKKTLGDKPNLLKFIEKEYLNPNISVASDKWIILSLLKGETRRFLWEEYFIYYQASYNHMLSMLLSFVIYLIIYFPRKIMTVSSFLDILKLIFFPLISIALSIFFGNVAFNWKIAIRRLARKIILYSQLYD